MSDLSRMYVLTVKRDGGTQDVVGFYDFFCLGDALNDAKKFLAASMKSRRAIIRLEYYNPEAEPPEANR